MALKRVLDSLDGVDEAAKTLYAEKDGQFHLDVEDDPDAGKLGEFRSHNKALFLENERLKSAAAKAEADMQAAEQAAAEAAKKGDGDKVTMEQRLASLEAEKTAAAEREAEAVRQARRTGLVNTIQKAGIANGVKKTALGDFSTVMLDTYDFDDDGTPFVPDGSGGKRVSVGTPGAVMTVEEHIGLHLQDATHWVAESSGDGADGDGDTLGGGKTKVPKADTANFGVDDWEKVRKGEIIVDMG